MITQESRTAAGIWMIVSSLCYDPSTNFETLPNTGNFNESYMNSFQIATKWRIDKDHDNIHKFWLVNTENIVDTAYVIPDIDENCNLSKDFVIVVKKKNEWKEYFVQERDRVEVDDNELDDDTL